MEVSDDHPDLVEMGLSLLGYFNSSAVPPQWPQIDERSNPQCRIFTTSGKMKNFSKKKSEIFDGEIVIFRSFRDIWSHIELI